MDYGIVVFPQKAVQDIINSYRKRYDPHYSLIPPHITLKEKFELSEENLDEAVAKLDRIAQEVKRFSIKFHKVSHFYPTSNTIYLAIQNSDPLIELHNKIKDAFGKDETPYDFIPHLTIGQKMSEDELHDVYGSLRMRTFELETKIDRFHLMYQLENKSWTVYQSFLLAK
ncbi:2'-5' RNA ligase family protein [Paenactinomyces guangxiensis]|uniref:Putative phosphoesterase H1191_03065 n=1 Tax=Paenactinomyces guangxiensis TaxID=1490290 RepID=A0A7W2A6E7_9BACL|nr:2'-5' RNA ligase family protein [Paenactinomyces guangxiensis]MBA4493291.1 2'-5' RNA ligase family protein [Paenactinomyces guangxiensis]MBH8589858.1 2'-5' RNA ligase family protein [Paenactinomyces guangxiensis]